MFAACARTRGAKVPPSERSDPLTDEDAFMMTALLDGERGFLTYKSSGHPVAPGSTCELTVDLPSPSVMVWSWEEAWGRDILFKVELPGHASQCHPQLSRLAALSLALTATAFPENCQAMCPTAASMPTGH